MAAAQSAAAADRAGSARWRGAGRGNRPLRDQVCMRHFPFVNDGSIFSRTRLMLLKSIVTSYQHSRWSGRSMLIFPNVTSKDFLSGYISLYQASRISRPLDVALTICQCGPRFSVSILFFFKEPTFLERAPGGSHPSGIPISRGAHLLKNKKREKHLNYS